MLAISLALALMCIVGGYVWGWVELGRAWNRQNLRVDGAQCSPTGAPVPPIPPAPVVDDGHFVPRRLDVFPTMRAHESFRRYRRNRR